MILLPAIDLYDGKVVRLTKGDYAQMTVYRDDPAAQAADFQAAGAKYCDCPACALSEKILAMKADLLG